MSRYSVEREQLPGGWLWQVVDSASEWRSTPAALNAAQELAAQLNAPTEKLTPIQQLQRSLDFIRHNLDRVKPDDQLTLTELAHALGDADDHVCDLAGIAKRPSRSDNSRATVIAITAVVADETISAEQLVAEVRAILMVAPGLGASEAT